MKIFKNKKKKCIIITSLASTFLIMGLANVYHSSIPKEESLIGFYIDGTYSKTLPAKGSGYAVEKITCDNNKNASWDYNKWGIKFLGWGTRSRCNIYFKSLESITLANKLFYLDEAQQCPTLNGDGTVTVTGIEDTYGYLCKAKDAYGDSYYYRGNVTNNYVLFAGKYWRIIRYNGDGTVRVIYDGTIAHANGDASVDRRIGSDIFNEEYNDNTYVGYMYGNREGIVEQSAEYSPSYTGNSTYYVAKEYNYDASADKFTLKNPIAVRGNAMSDYVGYYTFTSTNSSISNRFIYKIVSVTGLTGNLSFITYGTTSKEKAQTNINSSDIKTYLDKWYENNIKGTSNEQYIADSIFCNDRSFAPNNSGDGAAKSMTYYRWYNFTDNINNDKMMLTCPQKNDAFTLNDTSKGNGELTYGIGLITTDEVVLSGGWKSSNSNYYLYTGFDYWTMSPYLYFQKVYIEQDSNFGATVRIVASNGSAGDSGFIAETGGRNVYNHEVGIRPVLNLSSEILNNGNGTASDPYHA